MKKPTLFLFSLLLSHIIFGQIVFEKGYFIDNTDKKNDCFIKNVDWKNNPNSFDYKLSEDDEVKTATIDNVKAFAVEGYQNYIRAEVNIDRSCSELSKLSKDGNPLWSKETLFLKVLIDGKANLYSYNSESIFRLFYSTDEIPIQQLIYKEFVTNNNILQKNNGFRQQLLNDVRLPNQSDLAFANLAFSRKKMETFFNQYNDYYTEDEPLESKSDQKSTVKRDRFNMKLAIGGNYSGFEVRSTTNLLHQFTDFKKALNKRAGLEFEFMLPFNKNKWSIIVEPTYQQFKTDTYYSFGPKVKWHLVADFNYLEFPVGIRHYFYLNNQTKLYLTGYFVPELGTNFNSKIQLADYRSPMSIYPNNTFAASGGICIYRFNAEVRYYTRHQMLKDAGWDTHFDRLYFIVGFRFL